MITISQDLVFATLKTSSLCSGTLWWILKTFYRPSDLKINWKINGNEVEHVEQTNARALSNRVEAENIFRSTFKVAIDQTAECRSGPMSQLPAGQRLTLTWIWSRGESKDAPVPAPWSAHGTGPGGLTSCGATGTSSKIPGSSACRSKRRPWDARRFGVVQSAFAWKLTWWGSISSGTRSAAHCQALFGI